MVDVEVIDHSQEEEILALSSIYGSEFRIIDNVEKTLEFQINNEKNSWWSLTLRVTLPSNYPNERCPFFKIYGECLSDLELKELQRSLDEIWKENAGNCILHLWVERCREFIDFFSETSAPLPRVEGLNGTGAPMNDDSDKAALEDSEPVYSEDNSFDLTNELTDTTDEITEGPVEIISGAPITDRKSTFQAHVGCVSNETGVKLFMEKLLENRKIARASHNVMAFRIAKAGSSFFLQDNDDDGEKGAGSKLMHLLQILDARNVIVVVSRWYGGILLGPDRFKHINNCARELIMSTKFSVERTKKHAKAIQKNISQSKAMGTFK